MDYLRELNGMTILIRVIMALIIGGCLGLERESKKQPAGFRTYMLVCVAAASVMITNQYIYNYFDSGDPSRMGAQVISGIGFLGAGTIMVTRDNRVRGLTTAAGLWASACLGLAIGIGFLEGACIVGLSILMIMTVFKKIDNQLMFKSKSIKLCIKFETNNDFKTFMSYIKHNNIKVLDLQITKGCRTGKEVADIITTIILKNTKSIIHSDLIYMIGTLDGIINIQEL